MLNCSMCINNPSLYLVIAELSPIKVTRPEQNVLYDNKYNM